MRQYKRLFTYLKPYVPQIGLASLCTMLVAASTLLIAPLAGNAFKAIGDQDFQFLNLTAAGIIGLYFLKGLFTYGQEYLSYHIANKVIIDLRQKLYRHLEKLSLDFYGKWHSGEIISRMMNDITTLQTTILTSFTAIVPQTILLIGLIGYIFWLNWRLSLLTFVALPLIVQVIRMFATELRHISERVQQKSADITSHVQETISQIKTVQSFTMEEAEAAKFKKENDHAFHITMKAGQILATQSPVIAFLQAIAAVGIVWYGGLEIIGGRLTLPQLISFATALGIMTDPGSTLSKSFTIFQQGMASAKRIFELLDAPVSIVDKPGARTLPRIAGKVELANVSFAYEKEAVLENINLTVEPGEMIALIGRTGSGKSTLANLLPRFWDPRDGKVMIDGHDLRDVTLESLRRQIAVVPQEIALFRGTIKENLRYGRPDATEAEVVNAAKAANAYNFITELPKGFETEVGERGAKLSGGEKQRIAIARAILRDPRILILDEATSSLDVETESLLREALEKLMAGRTSFVIAHRLYTVEKASRVVVLDNGRIVEVGTHQELLARGGLYQYLNEIQLKNKA
ncbi:MAG: ABC transporter ATP-binding protein/permease [Candidatus Margulisbacteria bacterium]|nr:ABC transporter ATP-binding protein/permease [Candidatus Margulisiibacteriota bacterium]MBU1616586.1 ABC transporter ATP-binding protein/permease [Candidatus Margulisiibacteriota bacterium]